MNPAGYTGGILGPYLLDNFKNARPKGNIAGGGFEVVVGGDAYGTGSSREAAVVAHQGAGIKLVVVRIFQENMVYCGLPFTTDFSVLEALVGGRSVDLGTLNEGHPPFFRAVAESGGQLPYGTRLMGGAVRPSYPVERAPRPMTCVEKMVDICNQNGIRLHGLGRDHPAGVCHRVVVERYGMPGTVIVLTDRHTPTAGVLNAFAFGVGSTAMAFALRTGLVPVTVPRTVRVVVRGDAQGVLSPKDLILHIIGDPFFREERWRSSPTDTCVAQFGGPGLEQWDTDELSVLTNMTVEGGLMTGIVEPTAP